MKITNYISIDVNERTKTITVNKDHIKYEYSSCRRYNVKYHHLLDVVTKRVDYLIEEGFKVVYEDGGNEVLLIYNK